jgi:hypothetical protein
VGTISAIVLVPAVRFVWRRLAPGSSGMHLTSEARRRGAAISREALVVAFASLGLWAFGKGLATELGPLEIATAIGIILGVPFWWVLLRTRLRSKEALAEYGAYVESTDGVSCRSLCVVAIVATAVATVCGLVSYVQAP